jgi:hypothetical protein
VAVWAISAQKGAGGRHIAELLAAAAEVPLYDGASVASLDSSSTIERLEFLRLERRFRRFNLAASSVAAALGLPDAVAERAVLRSLPDILRTIVSRAARVPCVIYMPAAFAAAREHPHVVNARIRAPFGWRVANYHRHHLVALGHAESHVKRDDRLQRRFARTLWQRGLDDEAQYAVVLDASRLPADRVVGILLEAAGAGDERPVHGDVRSA